MKNSGKRGFTLTELLITIGILGILFAILLLTINFQRVIDQSQDSVRKSDLSLLHKAFVQYYIEHNCLPSTQLWNSLSCDAPIPAVLEPYLSSLPCDPKTKEKYYYQTVNSQCQQCNGGCGECTGFRFLTQLKLPTADPPPASGCTKDVGCGVNAPDGTPYNYGIAMTNACTINAPLNTITPTVSATTPTPTPIPLPTQIMYPGVGKECIDQRLTNGSFELTDANRQPIGWTLINPIPTFDGIYCGIASHGNCLNITHNFNPQMGFQTAQQTQNFYQDIPLSLNAGSTLYISLDTMKSDTLNQESMSGGAGMTVTFNFSDNSTYQTTLGIGGGEMIPYVWNSFHFNFLLNKALTSIRIANPKVYSSITHNIHLYVDNICVAAPAQPIYFQPNSFDFSIPPLPTP